MCVSKNTNNAIMNTLHKSQNGYQNFESREGQRGLLCSNKKPFRCPSLEFISEEDQSLDCLASIIVEAFIKKKRNELNKPK
jgi:hypothetical protein